MQSLKTFTTQHRNKIIPAVLTLAGLIVGYLGATQTAAPELAARVTATAPGVSTPKPPRVTPPTSTPGSIATATSTLLSTATPGATSTPFPTATPGSVSGCLGWHPFGFDALHPELPFHHHGVNPCDPKYLTDFGPEYENYLNTYGVFGFPSSAVEAHMGYVFLEMHTDTCQLFITNADNYPENLGCISDAVTRVHEDGTGQHLLLNQNHSGVGFYRVCDLDMQNCGTIILTGLDNYGVVFAPYKQALCNPPALPFPYTDLAQPPYRAAQPAGVRGDEKPAPWGTVGEWASSHLWSTSTFNESVIGDWYADGLERPNWMTGLTWSVMDAKDFFDCGNLDFLDAGNNDASRFMLFTIKLTNIPLARPFIGTTNKWGHVVDCLVGPTCYPIYIGANVPAGLTDFWYSMVVAQNGDNPLVPQQEFHP